MDIIGIPYRKLTIASALSPDELASRIKAVVSPRQRWFRGTPKQFEFIGNVCKSGFRLVPNVKGLNTYQPWIRGKIADATHGARIEIVQSLHPIAVIIVAAFFLWVEYLSFSVTGEFNTFILLAFIGFHLVMYFIGFLSEAKRSALRIKELAS